MNEAKKLIVSHAPFVHNGNRIATRNYNIMLAALPAVVAGVYRFGGSALGVLCLSTACAMGFELIMNLVTRRKISIGTGGAAVVGLMLGMMLPATAPWWLVVVGNFVAIVAAMQIYGGMGGNPFNPACTAMAILGISWKLRMNFDAAMVDINTNFSMSYPMALLKNFGPDSVSGLSMNGLLMGAQNGGIGTVFGLGLILGGLYLILRGYVRWEIPVAYLAGVAVTAALFAAAGSGKYAGPAIHLLSGYTLFGAFFLLPEDSSSPVNFLPMILYGLLAGVLTVLIRDIGADVDGVVFSVLLVNLVHPLLDKIRPKALGKVVEHA
ncbi:MAG: RnfABCDGE type electron transport complex subunit D [Thermodesulfobacteriota bacterium]